MSNEVVFDNYDAIREALYHPDLSRSFDSRSFEEGNPRANILSVLHGDDHKARRRIENPLFHRSGLIQYERELFPAIIEEVCARRAVGAVDLFDLGGVLSVVLAARRAGIDHDGSSAQLDELFGHVKVIAQSAAVLDLVGDRSGVQAETKAILNEFNQKYVTPSRRRRERLLDAIDRGDTDQEPPHDLLTVALRRRRAGDTTFDDGLLVREAGLFVHGGSHTSAQTLCNVWYYLLGLDGTRRRDALLEAAATDTRTAQRCVHETLRLRPTNPRIKRLVVRDTQVGGIDVPQGTRVVLDVRAANRDTGLFGPAPEQFNPDRSTREDIALWGLSFGAGPHICIGRSAAGGFPLTGQAQRHGTGAAHLFGLVALMVQAVAARGVRADPDRPPVPDERTDRGTRWLHFPVLFPTHDQRAGVYAAARPSRSA